LSKRLLIYFSSLVLFTLLFVSLARPSGGPEAPAVGARPKLILILIIDQFRYDYLVRFRSQFVKGGFSLLLSGANFTDCRYDYASTVTASGHATLLTGAYPNLHGIIGNEWYDRALHRRITSVEDPNTRAVGAEGPGASPWNLVGDTLGDELRLASGFESRVFSISLKDRSAVLPGGHTANAAYWYDSKAGHFISSTYYMPDLPSWVAAFNAQIPAKPYCGKPWQAVAETPLAGGKVLREFKAGPGEACPDEKFIGWLENTPFMSEIQLKMVREAIKNEHLGQGPATDLMVVSLSANDYIGHAYGPYSPEVADTTVRTDRYLADFLIDLDRRVGLNNVWIALSADHGVAPNPRTVVDHHLGPGMAPLETIKSSVEKALQQNFGEDKWVESFDASYIYLNQATLKNHHITRAAAEAVAAEAAADSPGVSAAYTRTQLMSGALPGSPLARKASNSFNSQRSGDVFLALSPYAVPAKSELETTHGGPWNYDAQVPLVFWGSAFRPGVFAVPCEPIDLASTLAAALGLSQASGTQGRVLSGALK
jgi:predicted AlkP superfamily pyrophosphatase or phosphodiesterase